MGRWGDVFGIPFAFEGVFFLLEAIFISIYIYGWRRLKPWTHFLTGIPIVLAGILGAALGRRRERMDEHARRDSPSTARARSTKVDPVAVIFNDRCRSRRRT